MQLCRRADGRDGEADQQPCEQPASLIDRQRRAEQQGQKEGYLSAVTPCRRESPSPGDDQPITNERRRPYSAAVPMTSYRRQPREPAQERIPAENRKRLKAALLEQWAQPSRARLGQRAQLIYRTFAGDEAARSYSGEAAR